MAFVTLTLNVVAFNVIIFKVGGEICLMKAH